jgi:hypothetical protein
VRGGIEDWAYAGSWGQGKGTCYETGKNRWSLVACDCLSMMFDAVVLCSYPASQSSYSSDMLRTINFLVETTDDKRWRAL